MKEPLLTLENALARLGPEQRQAARRAVKGEWDMIDRWAVHMNVQKICIALRHAGLHTEDRLQHLNDLANESL